MAEYIRKERRKKKGRVVAKDGRKRGKTINHYASFGYSLFSRGGLVSTRVFCCPRLRVFQTTKRVPASTDDCNNESLVRRACCRHTLHRKSAIVPGCCRVKLRAFNRFFYFFFFLVLFRLRFYPCLSRIILSFFLFLFFSCLSLSSSSLLLCIGLLSFFLHLVLRVVKATGKRVSCLLWRQKGFSTCNARQGLPRNTARSLHITCRPPMQYRVRATARQSTCSGRTAYPKNETKLTKGSPSRSSSLTRRRRIRRRRTSR